MIYCKECGKVNPDGTKFCGGCGTPLEQPEVVVQAQPVVEPTTQNVKGEAKCWRVFGRVGFGLGLASLICAASFVASSVSLTLAQPGLIFSILGMVSKIKVNKKKALAGIILSVCGFGIVLLFSYIMLGILKEWLRSHGVNSNDIFQFAKLFMYK